VKFTVTVVLAALLELDATEELATTDELELDDELATDELELAMLELVAATLLELLTVVKVIAWLLALKQMV
jgi:hypothetical protein